MRDFALLPILVISVFLFISCGTESTPTYTLSASVEPQEAGSITQSANEVEEGQSINVTANANDGWVFQSWSGDYSGTTNTASILMDRNKSVKALFTRLYPLTINTVGQGSVSEEVISQKTTDYIDGTIVKLTAMPDNGWELAEWQGDLSGNLNPIEITVNDQKEVTAVFQEATYKIEIDIEGEGVIKLNPEKDSYKFGDQVEISIEPANGWSFVYWDGDLTGTDRLISLSIESDVNANAILDENPFAGGNGSKQYPYKISDINQLQLIKDYIDGNFVLTTNIDASGTQNWNSGLGFSPIGDDVVRFIGSLDGKDYQIDNLFINRPDQNYVGLFGSIGEGSQISNIQLHDLSVNGNSRVGGLIGYMVGGEVTWITVTSNVIGNSSVGGVIGSAEGGTISDVNSKSLMYPKKGYSGYKIGGIVGYFRNGEISNVHTEGEVRGYEEIGGVAGELIDVDVDRASSKAIVNGRSSNIGGLIGISWGRQPFLGITYIVEGGTLSNSYFEGEVNGSGNVGGLVGIHYGLIKDSYAIASIKGRTYVGGITGQLVRGEINSSYFDGEVVAENYVGGLVGNNERIIQNSYSTGLVEGVSFIGGLVGSNESEYAEIRNTYSNSNVNGDDSVGGLIGVHKDGANLYTSYSTGSVNGNTFIGGLIGRNGANINNSFWDIDTSKQSQGVGSGTSSGIKGLNTNQLLGENAKENMPEFDWDDIWKTTDGYPILKW